MTPLDLLVLSLFAWYLAYVLVKTSGPFNVFGRIRGVTTFGGLLSCLYCLVLWTSVLGYLLLLSPYGAIVYIGGASGGAMIMYRYTGGDHG